MTNIDTGGRRKSLLICFYKFCQDERLYKWNHERNIYYFEFKQIVYIVLQYTINIRQNFIYLLRERTFAMVCRDVNNTINFVSQTNNTKKK